MVGGRRLYGPARDDPHQAHRDAVALRDGDATTPLETRTIGEAADAMHAELEGSRSAGTVSFYRQQQRAVGKVIDLALPLARLTPSVLQELIRHSQRGGFSARTIQHYRRWLHRLVVWASKPQRQWFRGPNPVPLATWPEPRPVQPDVLDQAELAARLEQLRSRPADYDLVLFLAFSGLRRSELARLRGGDFDFARNVLWVRGKVTNEAQPITAGMLDAARGLVERAGPGGWIVAGENEKRRVQAIDRVFRRWAKACGDRRCHPHALRHSLATNLIRAGVGAGTVQRMLRHSSYATTQRYVHLVAEDLHAAAGRLHYVAGGLAQQHG